MLTEHWWKRLGKIMFWSNNMDATKHFEDIVITHIKESRESKSSQILRKTKSKECNFFKGFYHIIKQKLKVNVKLFLSMKQVLILINKEQIMHEGLKENNQLEKFRLKFRIRHLLQV